MSQTGIGPHNNGPGRIVALDLNPHQKKKAPLKQSTRPNQSLLRADGTARKPTESGFHWHSPPATGQDVDGKTWRFFSHLLALYAEKKKQLLGKIPGWTSRSSSREV